jgi:DNA-binding MarR family transcriptional regulator
MTSTESTSPAGRLAVVIGRLNRKMISAGGGLSHGLLSSLATVSKKGPLRLADLAAIELVSAPSITRIVADLEAQSLVQRTVDPDDGRAFLIATTIKGTELIEEARSSRAQLIAELVDALDIADRNLIITALPALEKLI